MTKAEIKEIAKGVYKEEQDYQQLFKTMLTKSGKDINSMSDEDKRKFFNAVDKAYKAKTEGKLRGYDSKQLDESLSDIFGANPFLFAFASRVVGVLIMYLVAKTARFLMKKDYKNY